MAKLLNRLQSPQDLKKLSLFELESLAAEIREFLIKTVAQTGGHLAPNLGVVELSLALHYIFHSPEDKIVWDVGHQSYVHKLLTGRKDQFATLRQYKGLCGFPKRQESPHDVFETGHSSTSISAALGLALARDLKKEKGAVVAVIGDGALTGGMAFEALNYAGHLGTDLIVILNDNEMSIANNVGALSSYLTRMRTDPRYFKGKEEMEELLRKIPSIGPSVLRVMERFKDGLKYLMMPGMLFEDLGFTYLGPIDGHNLKQVKTVLRNARGVGGPVLVHLLTVKGKGYGPAEKNPDKFHGIGPFDITTGEPVKGEGPLTYTDVFSQTLVSLAHKDPRVLAITAAMPDGTGLKNFASVFPERFFDVGIAEEHAVTMAAALALGGFKPVVAIYSTFLQRAYDQIIHDVCLQEAPVVFAIDRGGLVGEDGVTHQGVFDLTFLRSIPNLVVMAPKDENELRNMLKTCLEYPGPIAVRYPRGRGQGVSLKGEPESIPIGQGEVVVEGSDLAVLAVGPLVYAAMEASEVLKNQERVSAAVINCRFVKPLDKELILAYARKTGKLITVEENVLAGGFGSAILELLEEAGLSNVAVKRIGIGDHFVEHGAVEILKEVEGLTAKSIAETARTMVLGDSGKPENDRRIKIAYRKESI